MEKTILDKTTYWQDCNGTISILTASRNSNNPRSITRIISASP